ncbi:hypothetical protein DOTSEDRAFT_70659 [Dothistroma septosporum NZE10]|uniref:Calcineurin-like phosphoesterase domain-containing protein n=1 Tax=Dothistroma septosporum (strain NZE10 / CBS 128990) TaxID=675120 RepID=N1PTD5_DOTSN|nr:hypothetical protein DOTSEDRAFT_70659 [Dothistroma septosporum NZE10]
MQPRHFFFGLARFLLAPALLGTVYLYLYPLFQQCGFPKPTETAWTPDSTTRSPVASDKAPFRLLALADPQLEGDTSLPNANAPSLPSLRRIWQDLKRDGLVSLTSSISREGRSLLRHDLTTAFRTYRKRLDLWGNDLYLAHVYRTVHWYTDPTHVTVLGDLLGSQWINDDEFAARSRRFWHRVFKGATKVEYQITDAIDPVVEPLGADSNWKNKIITIAGNHDIGYAGDLDMHRMQRFESEYGRLNWDMRFALPSTSSNATHGSHDPVRDPAPSLQLVVLNSMNLDEPAKDPDLLQDTLDYVNRKLYWELAPANAATILLTHIPLFKEEGVCADGPFFDYYEDNVGAVKEQNHLSYAVSDRILSGLIGLERTKTAVVLNGHDHTGCHVYHTQQMDLPDPDALVNGTAAPLDKWHTTRFAEAENERQNNTLIGVREVTVRSMMGEFGGNAGFLSAWWDEQTKQWKFDYTSCKCGVQHIWWAVHVLDIVVLASCIVGVLAGILENSGRPQKVVSRQKKTS